MSETVSERICRQIEERIQSGALAPGDRVPSARQIMKEWQVAIATATKVQRLLRDRGLVRALPGIGTVVAPRAVAGPRELGRESIVAAAIALADADGLAALSMRAVAARLGVATMSLYRHVPGKDELLLLMLDAAFGEAVLPTVPPRGWRARLELLARRQWWLAVQHPWLAHVLSMARPQLVPNAMAHTEWVMRALDGTGLSLATAVQISITIGAHVRAHALDLESERQAFGDSGLTVDEWMASQSARFEEITRARSLHLLSKMAGVGPVALDPESVCFFGLDRLLDGIGLLIQHK